ncbi:MAG: multicopper oxidase domain-containing protein [Proteobacteria bacterium]|nr:multicopper oxidase domain-containing protein [Pseudomonadota bacterium]
MRGFRNHKRKSLAIATVPFVLGLVFTGKASAVTNLVLRTVCPGNEPGTCLANFTGGLLTSTLTFPFAMQPVDKSKLTPGVIGGKAVNLQDGVEVTGGALVGGATGTVADVRQSLKPGTLIGTNSFDIPSGAAPSPLFGALPFSQKLVLFEEFGPEALQAATTNSVLPQPVNSSRLANTTLTNPWWNIICGYLSRNNCTQGGPTEGRPEGEGWAHQRWNEFFPVKAFKTAQAGARMNRGFRDKKQMHGYAVGEFGPGGLYYNTVGVPGFNGTTAGIKPQFHPKMPVQHHHSLWTFDGTFPVKLLMARYGEPVLMRHYNALPIDVSANNGFGMHTISTHEHNGHNPAESDGFAGAFFFPGQFYDYRWPVTLAGNDTINTDAVDTMAATPCKKGEVMRVQRKTGAQLVSCDVSKDPNGLAGNVKIRGDYRETMSTHWFHDHMLDFTSQNVYKGNAAMMNYYSAIDRGNESINDGVNLRLPSGSGLPWGNRDYDVNLVVSDKAWDQDGQLWFNPFHVDGFLGDNLLTNLTYKPVLEVRARRYRFRILNGDVARYVKIALVKEVQGNAGTIPGPIGKNISYERVVFHMIANDGNIMEHAIAMDGTLGTEKGVLPVQAIAERYDIIVDFAKNGLRPGDKLYFVNLMEHKSGKRPERAIALEEVLSEKYKPLRNTTQWTKGDPAVGAFLRFDVVACKNAAGAAVACTDPSLDPVQYAVGNRNGVGGTAKKMIVRPVFTAAEIAGARHRTFDFGRSSGTDALPWTIKTDGGAAHTADTRRISAAPSLGNLTPAGQGGVEIWHLTGGTGGWSHPVHIHFEEGQILNRDGQVPPIWEQFARKDMFRIGGEANSSSSVSIAYRFREFSGSYVEHCHNTTHEDHAMLVRWDIERPGQTLLMPSPIPTWDGVRYVDSVAESSFRTGDPSQTKP